MNQRLAHGLRVMLAAALTLSVLASAGTAAPKTQIVGNLSADIGSLDPIRIRSGPEQSVAANVFAGLLRIKPGTGEIEAGLAERWGVSRDGLTYTFHLRKGAQFHHGYGEVKASDVKFSFERHMDPSNRSRYRADFALVKSIDTPDEHTVVIRLTKPNPGWPVTALAYRPGWIVSQRAVKERGTDFGTAPVSAGPYAVSGYQRGQHVMLEAHAGYYGPKPRIQKAILKPIPEETVAFAGLRAGDLDVITVRLGETLQQAQADRTLGVHKTLAQHVWSIYFNTTRPPLNDVRVRKALAYAIDRGAFVKNVMRGAGTVADSVLGPATWGHTSDFAQYTYDPNLAKKLLREAGVKPGTKIEFVYPFQAPYDTMAEVAQGYWNELGLDVKLVGMERAAMDQRVAKGDYDVTDLAATRPPDPDVYFTTVWHSANVPPGGNFSFYKGADDLIEKARVEVDRSKRLELVKQVQKKIAADVPGFPMFYSYAIVLARLNLKGVTPTILEELWLPGLFFKE